MIGQDPRTDFRVFRAQDAVLIRSGSGEIELTLEAAKRLGRELVSAPADPAERRNLRWTPERVEEFRRLYIDENWDTADLAAKFGISENTARVTRHRLGIPSREKTPRAIGTASRAKRRRAPE